MKFYFKIQQYQTDAINAVIEVFKTQIYQDKKSFTIDKSKPREGYLGLYDEENFDSATRYKNAELTLSDDELLKNIHALQDKNNIKLSTSLVNEIGRCSLDISMETGTGKTYVYIKTIFELHKNYGFSKFIVVVPSIAIREGVKKTFEMTTEHFMEHYNKKARFFVYNSSNLNELNDFSSSHKINVMIINTQAFATSLKEDGKSKQARIIYSKRDEFNSKAPIEAVRQNKPIIILDEPQKMGGEVTKKALKNFDPLFLLNYSATHKEQHNLIYALNTLDAYKKKLVKKIEVKGFELKNLRGTDGYLYLEQIVVSSKKPPMAKIELEINYNKSIEREMRIVKVEDDLYKISKEMEQYKGFVICDIDARLGTMNFTNGLIIHTGDVRSDELLKDIGRIQIRETILSHFEKEETLFNMGIKTLSLFFIDEVAKYRQYDENTNEILGEYGKIFEEEYKHILSENINSLDSSYQRYLKSKCNDVSKVHNGYFSIDRKTKRNINSEIKRGSEFSDDILAYDLILKNKERLLSFDEPTRFIFSHSALREGWDNPNVFQICTLKHSMNQMSKRQEVGRGLRLCVDQNGNRMDMQSCGDSVHDINILTVIASQSYKSFVEELQTDIKSSLTDRPKSINKEYFIDKKVKINGVDMQINDQMADEIQFYLIENHYVDKKYKLTDKYRDDLAMNNLVVLPTELEPIGEGIHALIQAIYDENILENMFRDGHMTTIKENTLNNNFYKQEFQELWKQINHKYVYVVDFNTKELIEKAIKCIDEKLFISELKYTTALGTQKEDLNQYDAENKDMFILKKSETFSLKYSSTSQSKYDLIGKIAKETVLTRGTIATILKEISAHKFALFQSNPEEFISNIIKLIKEQKATMIIEHISYNKLESKYESEIFTVQKSSQDYNKAFRAFKAIQDYVFTDGTAKQSVERRFVEDLDIASEVCVYAKLPKGFYIPTPVGNYSPDWAIAFDKEKVKHIFFVAETKGSMESLELRKIEEAKISCAKKLFNEICTNNVRYDYVDSYEKLLDIVKLL